MAQSIAQLNKSIKANTIAGLPVNDLEDQRDLLANQLVGGERRDAARRRLQPGQRGARTAPRSCRATLDRVADASTRRGTGAVLRWTTDNSAASVTSGKAGGELNEINATIPNYLTKLDTVATTLRDQVNQVHGAIGGSLAVADQDQSAAGNLKFDIALDNGAFATVSVAGADWSGAGGAAALQTALQTRGRHRDRRGQRDRDASRAATAVRCRSGSPRPARTSCRCAPTARPPASRRCSATRRSAPTASAAGSSSPGPTRASLAVSAARRGQPRRPSRPAPRRAVPLDASIALDLADMGVEPDRRRRGLPPGDRAARRRHPDGDEPRQDPAAATQSLDNARSQQSGVSIDEEMTNLVEFQHGYDAAARLLTTIDSMLDTLDQPHRTGMSGRYD